MNNNSVKENKINESILLSKLYSGELKATIQLIYNGMKCTFNLDLIDMDRRPDCCINHFGYNVFIRTNKGLVGERYKSLGNLKRACSDKLRENGITPVFLVVEGRGFIKRFSFNQNN